MKSKLINHQKSFVQKKTKKQKMVKYCIKTMYMPSKIPLTAFLMQLTTTFSKKHNTVNYLSEKRRKYYQYPDQKQKSR